MAENSENPNSGREAIRTGIASVIAARGLTQAAVARETGVSPSLLSAFLAGTYGGDNDGVAAKLGAWVEHDAKRRALVKTHGFLGTTVADAILDGLNTARILRGIVSIVAEPGYGKSTALEAFMASTGGNVWFVSLSNNTCNRVQILQEVAPAVGVPVMRSGADMHRALVRKMRGTAGFLIIDEGQFAQADGLDAIRTVCDQARIGMALCGNGKMSDVIGRMPHLESRNSNAVLLDRPTRADVAMIAAEYGVMEGEALDFLHSLSLQPGCLRNVVNVLRLAAMAAPDGVLSMPYLVTAWGRLGLTKRRAA